MGEEAQILLVRGRLSKGLCLAILIFAAPACKPLGSDKTVDAAEYDAFWLWAGVKPQGILETARAVYILEGEIRASGEPRLISLRPAVPSVKHADIWMAVRVETLDWNEGTYKQLVGSLERWAARSNVKGVQIDFDARTKHLDKYATFLRDLRRRIPQRYWLSITGLLDWSANGHPQQLDQLAGVVDEIVLQTYQGRKTIPGYRAYLTRLEAMNMSYRIGLVQGGEWDPPASLASDPDFKGYVVFLVNPAAPK